VKPGGEVAWHSHEDRPALIYVVSGTITEYSSHCAVPIEHKTGDLSVEQGGLAHWWKNNSKETTVLISADIARDPNSDGM
jgi:quercetin dioxygenase-like cupin family protein